MSTKSESKSADSDSMLSYGKGDSEDSKVNKCCLIINYIPQLFSEAMLKNLFQESGVTLKSVKICKDRQTGNSSGYGFVECYSVEDAERLINEYNGYAVENKKLKVSFSRPNSEDIKDANLFLKNIPKDWNEDALKNVVQLYGKIIQLRILRTSEGASRGVAFVLFDTKQEAQACIANLNGEKLAPTEPAVLVKLADENRTNKAPLMSHQLHPIHMRGNGNVNNNCNHQPFYTPDMCSSGFGCHNGSCAQHSFGFNNNCNSWLPPSNGGPQHGMNTSPPPPAGPLRNNCQPSGKNRFNPIQPAMGGCAPRCSHEIPPAPCPHVVGSSTATNNTLFVYNIGVNCEEAELYRLFSPFGAISRVDIIRDQNNENQAKFAFITMLHVSDAINAIQNLNGYMLTARPLQVSFKQ